MALRASRLLSIVLLLQNRGRMTGPELARELEVSVRTVYRDIDSLSAAGVPVLSDRGPDGGFRLLDGYRTRLTGLTPDEADSLFLTGSPGVASDLGLGAALATAELKLLAAMPSELRGRAEQARNRFLLDAPGWYQADDETAFLPLVASAVWEGRRVSWRYHRWGGVVDRTVDPLGLVMKGGVWYVVAAVDGAPRTYRVSRIEEATVLPEPATRPDGFDLATFWAGWAEEFNQRLYPDRATIRLSPRGQSLLPYFLDSYRTRMIRETAGPPDDNGWVTATVPIEQVGSAAMEMLHFGRELEVVAPAALRDEIARLATDIARSYAVTPADSD